ncbi:hypothetical protein [Tenacibaculum agarivorans]|uniref:hypothetical protein n=1 Tax=Tenacibaculum agarivorans TaxID=1908389 RepID=UPI00094BB064|nr:hypothetical protein [Tenacibaculum agarivorans]
MKNKITLVIILIGLTFFSFTNPHPTPKNNMILNTAIDGAVHYQKHFKQFNYYIETIGTVSIDRVALNNNQLTALYSYKNGNEIRDIISLLNKDKDGIYKGTCTTKVNGQFLFAVNTHLTFNDDGSATGNWNWHGTPSKNDPIVTISIKK